MKVCGKKGQQGSTEGFVRWRRTGACALVDHLLVGELLQLAHLRSQASSAPEILAGSMESRSQPLPSRTALDPVAEQVLL